MVRNIARNILGDIIAIAVGIGIGIVGLAAFGGDAPQDAEFVQPTAAHTKVRQYGPCPTEDSQHCIWRANVRGDREGKSFVAGDREGRRHYVSHKLARKLIQRHGTWQRVPKRLIGVTVDTPKGGSFKIGRKALISFGDTTYVIRSNGQVGVS